MKNLAITVFVILLVVILVLYLFMFQVRETESALVTTFGKPSRQLTEPGLYLRLPSPIQNVYKFDSRMRVFEADIGETTTKGAVPIIVKSYVVWKIAEPLNFFNAVGTVKQAHTRLLNQISDTQNKIIGQHNFSEFVNSDQEKIKIDQIENEMLISLRNAVKSDYGIEIKTFGIKQLKISKEVSKAVFERMSAERRRRTEATISQGNAEAKKIKTDADAKKTMILATAQARAKAIRGQGDAEAAKYYKLFEDDPEFAMFLRNIEALKKILKERSTLVISADSEPFKLLKEKPTLEPKK